MLELLLIEFRNWDKEWDIYEKNPQISKPPTQDEFLFYLREKYPELKLLDNITEQESA